MPPLPVAVFLRRLVQGDAGRANVLELQSALGRSDVGSVPLPALCVDRLFGPAAPVFGLPGQPAEVLRREPGSDGAGDEQRGNGCQRGRQALVAARPSDKEFPQPWATGLDRPVLDERVQVFSELPGRLITATGIRVDRLVDDR